MPSEVVDAEVVSEELTVRQVAIARPVITPDEAKEMVTELRQLISKILVKDKHYMNIRGRDVLLKAGAEELGKFFGLATSYHDLETHTEDGVFYASVKCSVSNAEGRILAESYGFYGGDEHRGKAPQNTIVKMAQKRAYVGAILTATGTSELFTQDVDDEQQAPAQPVVEDALASDDEKMILAGLYQQKKPDGTLEEGLEWIASFKSKGDSRNWVAKQCLNLLLRPDPPASSVSKPSPVDLQRLGAEPELPVESPLTGSSNAEGIDLELIPGQTTIEDDTEGAPF